MGTRSLIQKLLFILVTPGKKLLFNVAVTEASSLFEFAFFMTSGGLVILIS